MYNCSTPTLYTPGQHYTCKSTPQRWEQSTTTTARVQMDVYRVEAEAPH